MYLEKYEIAAPKRLKPKFSLFKATATQQDIGIFLMHLGAYLQAGIQLLAALESIASNTKSTPMRRDINTIINFVSGGCTLSEAISKLASFPDFVFVVLNVGESTGDYASVLSDIAKMILEQSKFKQEIRRRLRYPIFLLSMFLCLLFLACEFLLPEIINLTKAMNINELPSQTKVLIALSGFITNHTLIFWSFVTGVAVGAYYLIKLCQRVTFLSRSVLRIPMIGELKIKKELCRFYHLLGFMLSAKVPLRSALEITKNLPSNLFLRRELSNCCSAVTSGKKLSAAFNSKLVTTPMIHQAMLVGDQVGDIPDSISKAVAFEQINLKNKIDDAIRMLEPISICFMGAIFVWIIICLFAPLYMNLEF